MTWIKTTLNTFAENVGRGLVWIAGAGFLIGMAFVAVYLGSLENQLRLSPLEVFFVATTVASLGLNLYQHVKTRSVNRPLLNHLVGVFNDIKSKQQACWNAGSNLWLEQNPHKDVDTLRWEYAGFALMLTTSFQQLQEAVVAAIVTLDPTDPAGNRAFRAQEYGLTKSEREFRQMQDQQFLRSQKTVQQQGTPDAVESPTAEPDSEPPKTDVSSDSDEDTSLDTGKAPADGVIKQDQSSPATSRE